MLAAIVGQRDIVTALLLGVLLPALLSRPAALTAHPMREHVRRRWAIGYTMFAFAGAFFVYVIAFSLLKPAGGFTGAARQAVFGTGLLIFALLCANHIPPLLLPRRGALTTTLQISAAVLCGVLGGSFFAIDELYPRAHVPLAAYLSWAGLLLAICAVCLWYGPSPRQRHAWFRLRRRARRWRARRTRGR